MTHPLDTGINLFEAIHTQRAMRRLKSDPVPDEAIRMILEAATKAPSGMNRQAWRFIVVREAETRRRIATYFLEAFRRFYGGPDAPPEGLTPDQVRIWRSANRLAEHLGEVPVLIVVCLQYSRTESSSPDPATRYGNIFPAIQNLLLAARGLGLGTTLTTMHRQNEQEIKSLLGIPESVETIAIIPLGYPEGKFGPPLRRPVEEVTYYERWDQSLNTP